MLPQREEKIISLEKYREAQQKPKSTILLFENYRKAQQKPNAPRPFIRKGSLAPSNDDDFPRAA